MPRKRRREEEKLIKKLVARELRKCRRRKSSSSSTQSRSEQSDQENRQIDYETEEHYEMDDDPESAAGNDSDQNEVQVFHPSDLPAAAPTDVEKEIDKNEDHLDEEILNLLGDAPKENELVGKDIHNDIASRLKDILEKGLKKECKEKIIEDYPIPGNCQLFKSPLINPEIKSAVSDALYKKDASLSTRQGQIGVALSALTSAMEILITNKSESNQTVLKHVSNACRLLCDSHCSDTKLRRNFLVSTLNNKMKETLKDSKRDKFLFGESLSENIKATKAISKSGLELKSYVTKPKPFAPKQTKSFSSPNLNWKRPQPNPHNVPRKMSTMTHRTAGSSSTAHRQETPGHRRPMQRANRNSAYYKNQKKS